MQKLLGKTPTIVRTLDYVRDWVAWKEPLGIAGIKGITGKGSPHFYRFSLRKGHSNKYGRSAPHKHSV